jgi:hypothetical protein
MSVNVLRVFIPGLFNDAVATSDHRVEWKDDYGTAEDMEGSSCNLIWGTIPIFAFTGCRKLQNLLGTESGEGK